MRAVKQKTTGAGPDNRVYPLRDADEQDSEELDSHHLLSLALLLSAGSSSRGVGD